MIRLNILVTGTVDERFHRPLQLIANLFFEDTNILFADENLDDHSLKVELDIHADSLIKVQMALSVPHSEKIYKSSVEKLAAPSQNEKEFFKQIKKAVSRAFLEVLQQYTGIRQQWGFLTGIRPTKLLHKKLRNGISKDEAHEQLKKEYLISDEKIRLMEKIVDRQLTVIPDLYQLRNEVSIYIGIPFCPTKCAYCTFPAFAIQGNHGKVDSFLGGLHYEMEKIGQFLKENHIKITTIYYGGGTPTSITAEEMDHLYNQMYRVFPDVKNVREITVEAGRPDTITPEKLEVLKKWKIDRISINPQSYIQNTLKAIGRHHTVKETIEKFHLARRMGMNNINMDLIIGLPGEGVKEFQYSLDETEKLMPESLTIHTLSFKRASVMTKHKDEYPVASREEAEKMMKLAQDWTAEHNYVPYYLYRQKNILGNLENVGYALPGQECIYNILIMEEVQTIIGLGCGAASKFVDPETGKIKRFANPKDPKFYNERYEEYTEKKLQILHQLFCKRQPSL